MTTFKAPIKSLKSSWVQMAFSKPKAGNVIKRSLGSRPQAIAKVRGNLIGTSTCNHSNLY